MNRRYQEVWIQIFLFGIDIIGIVLAFSFAYWLRFKTNLIPITKGLPDPGTYIRALLFTIIVWEILFIYNSLYAVRKTVFSYSDIYKMTRSIVIGTFILMALTFVYRSNYDLSRPVVMFGLLFSIVFLNMGRWLFSKWLRKLQKSGWGVYRTMIVGTGPLAQFIADKIKRHPETGYYFVGYVDSNHENDAPSTVKDLLLGSIEQVDQLATQYNVNKIIIANPHLQHDSVLQLMLQSEKHIVDFSLAPDLLEMMVNRVVVDEIDGFPLLALRESPLKDWNIVLKRCMDISVSFLSLLLLSPFFGLIALLIKRDSPGGVFYLQERVGVDGKKFMMYKFRSMKVNAEADTGPIWASEDDPRRTKLGTFLRKHNIDEFPQLINVLKGDMSLVGPRPERPHFVNQFKEEIPRYMARHRVKSGITGWAQVNGWRGDTSIEERTKYDLYYIENWSLLFDVKIILMTFTARKNAY